MPDLEFVQTTEGPPQPPTILDLLDARRVKFTEPPPEPITIFSINGQSLSTSGNLTVISGQSKAGKSAAAIAMISSVIGEAGGDYLGFEAAPADGKIVLVFDTEQSPFHAWTLLARALHRAGCDTEPDNLHYFYILDLSVAQRREAVTAACRRAATTEKGVHCVFVDGLADLVQDVNDAAESNAFVSEMVRLSIEIDAPIIGILHENPAVPGAGVKTRGHLGSQLERKAESNLRVVKDADGVSTIFGERCRTACIPQNKGPRFAWSDERKTHVSSDSKGNSKADKARAALAEELEELYGTPDAVGGFTHGELLKKIADAFGLTSGGARKKFDKFRSASLVKKSATSERWTRCLVP